MDAKPLKLWAFCALFLSASLAQAATYATPNFVVTASTDEIARRVANCAEYWRRELAIQWLEQPLPNWYKPCPISVREGQIGAGGQTTFTFENGEVFGWKMQVQGTLERILDSVIPHEVNHTIFASHFRRPVPRWADEGAATLFEHESERARQVHLLNQVFQTPRRIPLKDLLGIKEYPADMQDVLTLYAEGYSLAEFLVGSKGQQGRKIYLKFLQDAHRYGWAKAIEANYGYASVDALEQKWSGWILAGSPEFQIPEGQQLAQAEAPAAASSAPPAQLALAGTDDVVVRAQNPAATSESDAPLAVQPLGPIPRQLRAGRTSGEPLLNDLEAGVSMNDDGLTNEVAIHEFRTRQGARPHDRPSLPPATLTPTADGIHADPEAKHYAFPEARR